jgi:acid stress-induced BolA-like protein IbaG/YrbA
MVRCGQHIMPTAEWMVTEVKKVYPDANIEAFDTTGSGDHWFIKIIDSKFEGMRLFQRQKPVIQHFKPHIATNYVHALDLKCWTPEQAQEREGEVPFSPHEAKRTGFVGLQVRRANKEE